MKFFIKNLSKNMNNNVLISCKSFNLFVEANDSYDI